MGQHCNGHAVISLSAGHFFCRWPRIITSTRAGRSSGSSTPQVGSRPNARRYCRRATFDAYAFASSSRGVHWWRERHSDANVAANVLWLVRCCISDDEGRRRAPALAGAARRH